VLALAEHLPGRVASRVVLWYSGPEITQSRRMAALSRNDSVGKVFNHRCTQVNADNPRKRRPITLTHGALFGTVRFNLPSIVLSVCICG